MASSNQGEGGKRDVKLCLKETIRVGDFSIEQWGNDLNNQEGRKRKREENMPLGSLLTFLSREG